MAFFLPLVFLVVAALIGWFAYKTPLKAPIRIGGFVLAAVLVLFGLRTAMSNGLIPTPGVLKAMVPQKVATFSTASIGGPVATYELPAQPVSYVANRCYTVQSIPWNATSSLTVANGGPQTASDSLVRKYAGACLNIQRQDDYGVQKDNLVKFASGWKSGDDSQGAAFAIMMGDQFVAYHRSVRDRLKALGQDIAVVGILGFSYGEDACMGKPLNGNPQNAKGSLIAAVPYDGDWDVCAKWASDNGIKINQDNSTFDPEAINFSDKTSFVEADEAFINAAPETRFLVKDGKKTTEKITVHVNGVATWTPGDVAVVQRASQPATKWASTKDYNLQMPAVLIANKDWAEKHRALVVGILRAADRAAFQIRNGDLQSVGRVNAAIYGSPGTPEASPDFWTKYFNAVDSHDSQGNPVSLGGSRVVGLAEARDFLGLTPGVQNTMKGIHESFCTLDTTFFKKDVPDCDRYEDIVDPSYIQAALQGVNTGATKQVFTEQKSISSVVSSRPYNIEFTTGSASLTSQGVQVVNQIANQAGMTGLRIRLSGHTDNTGNPTANLALSRHRAQAVADALTALAPQTFPPTRFEVQGYGDSSPVADNATAAGKAKNRRVEVTFGS